MSTQNPAERERRAIVRAGLFVALGLLLAGVVIVLIGKERNLFDEQVRYFGAFENVDGLQLDAPVRLGGLQCGRVVSISFAPDLGDKRIIVTMEIVSRYRERVRKDSVARVTSRGVLGDKAIDISLGSPEAPVLKPGEELETGSSGDLSAFLKASGEIIDNVVGITRDLKVGVASYTDPSLTKDVSQVVRSLKAITGEIETGKGAVHALIYDKRTSDELKALIAGASASAQKLDGAIGTVEELLKDVKHGDGTLHALVYDKKVAAALTELGNAAAEVASLVNDAKKSQNSAINQLVYGDNKSLFGDLAHSAQDLREILKKVKSGEGSLGGIIYDPTVYEDLKEILGNVKRNKVLRELVRISISNNERSTLEQTGKPQGPPPKTKGTAP